MHWRWVKLYIHSKLKNYFNQTEIIQSGEVQIEIHPENT